MISSVGGVSQTPGVQPGMGSGATGTSNTTYDLISCVYHCLESASTYEGYLKDVQGDQELTQFFQQCIEQHRQIADKAKQLLARRLAAPTTGH